MKFIAAALAVALLGATFSACGDSAKDKTMTQARPPSPSPSASRPPPPRVPPVFVNGIRYAQVAGDLETDGQVGGMLGAFDGASRQLWRLKVYDNRRRPELEGDVQDVWFRSLRAEGGRLVIENERGERFEVDPATRSVVGQPAPAAKPPSDIDPISGQPRIRRPG
jgi:hypothetical protein